MTGPAGYWVSDEPELIDIARVHGWLSQESYWAAGQPYDVTARAIKHSLSVGLYAPDGTQAGYARLVTDQATFAWLCDVFVDPAARRRGLGSFLVAQAIGHPAVAGIRQVLMAEPGRTIYRRHGYGDLLRAERWMERPAPVPQQLQELVDRDRQGADSLAGGVEDRVGDGGGHADQANLADALDPDRVEPVRFADEEHV
ncbi:MAG TPA: GNAT family N-acetyltransferase [Streptosporangiaceae bacterium]